MSKLHEGKFPVTSGIIKALALIRNVGEIPLFHPEICAEEVCGGIFKALNNSSETKVPSDSESIRARGVLNFSI